MRFALIGPGALGCLVSSTLSRGLLGQDDELHILDHNPDRALQLQETGISYEYGVLKEHHSIPTSSSPEKLGKVDVIFLTVKAYDVTSALKLSRKLLHPHSLLIFLQNGIGHLEEAHKLEQAVPVLGSTTEGATLLAPGHVRHAGKGITYLGFLDGASLHSQDLLNQTQLRLQKGGMETSLTDQINSRLWAKLFINVGINALTAIWDCTNGHLLNIAEAKKQMQTAIAEAVEIARHLGIEPQTDPYQTSLAVCKSTTDNVSSMLQDVRAKRCTEIEAINGAIVNEGKKLGIATPVNLELFEHIKKIERNY